MRAAIVPITARAAWALGAPPSGSAMQPVEPRQGLELSARAGPSPNDVRERRAERRGRAVALQEFRDRPLAEYEVGQQDRGDFDEVLQLLLDSETL